MNFQAASPISYKSLTLLDLVMLIFLSSIYLAMQIREVLMQLASDGRCSKELRREM